MRIAIDSGPLSTGDSIRGIGVYVRALTKALKLDGVDVFKSDLSKYDVVHFTSFNPFRISLPLRKPKKTKFILTIYDLIPLIYQEHYPAGVVGYFKWHMNKYLIKKNVDAIITISETSKKDICRFIGVNPDRVYVTYLAPRPVFKKLENGKDASSPMWKVETGKRYGLPDHFALYVGDVNYNKNIPNLIAACKIAKIPLVIVGKQATQVDKLDLDHPELSHLKNIDWSGVVRVGFVPDEFLVKLYNLASVYVQPSLYEGFGLPAVEAVVCGTPLAVARSQCMVEVLGDDFSYADANDPESLAKAVLHPNLAKKLPRKYSWEDTAKKTLEVYKNA